MNQFSSAHLLVSAADPAQFPADVGFEVAFAGRSNSGKSSALNALLGRRALARSGKTPGQTRLLNFFELGGERRVVDLPGYGYARVPEAERRRWVALTNRLRGRSSFRGLFLTVDSRRGVAAADLELIAWADPTARSVHVLLSKADKLTRNEATRCLADAQRALGGAVTTQLFSATDGTGVVQARSILLRFLGKEPGHEAERE